MVRRFLRITAWITSTAALVLFIMSGVGCNNQQTDAPDHTAKPMSGAHDGHKHGGAEKESGKSASGDAAKIAQKTCPVMGEEIDPEVLTMHDGRKVYFCCKKCIPKFKDDPAKYLAKLESGV